MARVLAAHGRVDILVNNAGGVIGQVGRPVEQVSDEEWEVVVRTNLFAASHSFAPARRR